MRGSRRALIVQSRRCRTIREAQESVATFFPYSQTAKASVQRAISRWTSRYRVTPDFLIIGVQKGGTTSLFRYLQGHPQVGRTYRKEPHYYAWNHEHGLDWYRSHFPLKRSMERIGTEHGKAIAGEASTHYIFYPEAARRAHAHLPAAKLILLLRDPVDRAFSHWRHSVKRKEERRSFRDAVRRELDLTPDQLAEERRRSENMNKPWCERQYVNHGMYLSQIKEWLSVYPREQLLILSSERFFNDTASVFRETLDFLELSSWEPRGGFPAHNVGITADANAEVRGELAAYFARPNQELETFLGQSFDW